MVCSLVERFYKKKKVSTSLPVYMASHSRRLFTFTFSSIQSPPQRAGYKTCHTLQIHDDHTLYVLGYCDCNIKISSFSGAQRSTQLTPKLKVEQNHKSVSYTFHLLNYILSCLLSGLSTTIFLFSLSQLHFSIIKILCNVNMKSSNWTAILNLLKM
jgi:hypothetical protein